MVFLLFQQLLVVKPHGFPQDSCTIEEHRKALNSQSKALPDNSHAIPPTERPAALDRNIISREKTPELKELLSSPLPTVCQNCIELNPATVVGFIFTEIVSIFLLAVGVYFIAGQEEARQSRGKRMFLGTSLVVQWLRLRAPSAGGQSLIHSQATRSHMPQVRPCAAK